MYCGQVYKYSDPGGGWTGLEWIGRDINCKFIGGKTSYVLS